MGITNIFSREEFELKRDAFPEELPGMPKICPLCYGAKMEVIPGKGARPCECVRSKERDKLLRSFPERNTRFGVPSLADLKPFIPDEQSDQDPGIRDQILEFQTRVIAHVQKNPFRSLNLCGKNKIGKSQIAFSILLNAHQAGRNVKFFKMKELLNDHAESARQRFGGGMSSEEIYSTAITPRLTIRELEESIRKYTILIDEFHNWILSSTESQFSNVFETLDSIKANRHQVVILSNYPFEWLEKAMKARKSKLGDSVVYIAESIISRINEEAETAELFF